MAREFSRTARVSQQLHKEIANILNHEFKHQVPEIGMVTVSGVEVSRDLAYAKVFVTFLEMDEAKNKASMKLLDEGKSFVRGLLGRRVKMRNTPALRFIQDSSITEGMRISNLVSQVRREDAKKSGEPEDINHSDEDE
ncbi:30S ribosome-binding factor RbfA [Alteromonas sp. LMIT006]|jgi:ribosome-binding factor A|uniref:30S ribosome-binding factor RbfA n=1 Tax=Alteromonadaceae TaxID=72275 RepID=UPI0020CA9867|nr:30S ribosome-binding factor RbfA [Alteromonas sp. LMIT006]UTP72460.1 30S ribosome-binding factor RbfA [Alteromonas sp. LMIT006]